MHGTATNSPFRDHEQDAPLPSVYDLTILLLRRKWWIAGFTLLCFGGGLLFARLAQPVFSASAVIIPKGQNSRPAGGGALLGEFNGLGGLLSRGPESGITAMKRLELSALSREMGERVVENHKLLPRIFPELWDAAGSRWKDPAAAPGNRDGYGWLAEKSLEVAVDAKNNLMEITLKAGDPRLALDLTNAYLQELNLKLREDANKQSEANLKFLEGQFAGVMDPQLRSKIQDLMAKEIERSMLANTDAFEVFEAPILPTYRIWPRPMRIALLATLCGLAASMFAVLILHFFGSFRTQLAARM